MEGIKPHSTLVKEFTEQSMGISCPLQPRPMTKEQVRFILDMFKSEMEELALTVCDTYEEAVEMVRCPYSDTKRTYVKKDNRTEEELIAEQVDCFVDIEYYGLNALAKSGINAEPVFHEVHQANMNKKHSDGQFHRREDGKVEKPEGWKEGNVVAVIEKQKKDGSWN